MTGGTGADIDAPAEHDLDARLGVRALLGAEAAADGLGDGATFFERRGFGSTSRGVVSPDLGRVEATDVARDGARDKPLEVDSSRDALVALLRAGAEDELGDGATVSPGLIEA